MDTATKDLPIAASIEDASLRAQVMELWESSRGIHAMQVAPGSTSDNGREHCLRVERNIALLVDAANTHLNDAECLLLSAAACCHDYGRSVSIDELALVGGDHGKASAQMVAAGDITSGLDQRTRCSLSWIVELHSAKPDEFKQRLDQKTPSPAMQGGRPAMQSLALLLRVADLLDMTMDRLAIANQQPRDLGDIEHRKTLLRGLTWWVEVHAEGIVISIRYRTPNEGTIIRESAAYVDKFEFGPLRASLGMARLPDRLLWDLDEDPAAPGPEVSVAPQERPVCERPQSCHAGSEHVKAEADKPATRPVAPALRQAQRATSVARTNPADDKAIAEARHLLEAGAADAYWLLSSLASVEWLAELQRDLQTIARSSNLNEIDALCTSLARMATKHPTRILESGVLLELWRGGTDWHRWRTLRMIGAVRGWETPFGRSVLDDVLKQHPEYIDQVSLGLISYAKNHAGRVGLVFDWYLAVMKRSADEKVSPGGLYLEWDLGELLVGSSAEGLRRAYDLIEAVLGDDVDSYSGCFKVRECTREYGNDTALAKVRLLLVTEINQPSGAHHDTIAKQVIRRLLNSEREALRALAFSALLDCAERSSDMLKAVLPCAAPLVDGATRDFALRYVYNVFSTLSNEPREYLEDLLLSVPLGAEEYEWRGIHRLRALEAVPEACRSERVQDAINGLFAANPRLISAEEPPDDPLCDGGWLTAHIDEPQLDLSAAADDLDALKEQMLSHLNGEDGSRLLERRYMVEAALMRLLAQRPELRIPVAAMISDLPTELYEVLVPGVVIVQEDARLDGAAALDLSRVLPDDPGSRCRQTLGYVIGKQWERIPEQRHPEGLLLLAKWTVQEPDPPAGEGGRRGESAHSLLTEAINTPRGILACMLVGVSAKVSDPSGVLDTITALASDPSIPVRAAVLQYLTPLLDSARGTAIRVVQDALADGHEILLPFAASVLRRLDPAEMVRIGFPLLERFILAEGKEAQDAVGRVAMLWLLSTDEPFQREWLTSLVRVGPDVMRQKAAHVAIYNTLGQNPDVMKRACQIAETLLAEGDVQHLAGLLRGVPMGVEGDWTKLQHVIQKAVQGGQREVLDEAVGLLGHYGSPPKAEIVAPLLEGLLETPAAMPYVFDKLNERHAELDNIYECLLDVGNRELALRFLDAGAACCVERLRAQIESAQLSDNELQPPKS